MAKWLRYGLLWILITAKYSHKHLPRPRQFYCPNQIFVCKLRFLLSKPEFQVFYSGFNGFVYYQLRELVCVKRSFRFPVPRHRRVFSRVLWLSFSLIEIWHLYTWKDLPGIPERGPAQRFFSLESGREIDRPRSEKSGLETGLCQVQISRPEYLSTCN